MFRKIGLCGLLAIALPLSAAQKESNLQQIDYKLINQSGWDLSGNTFVNAAKEITWVFDRIKEGFDLKIYHDGKINYFQLIVQGMPEKGYGFHRGGTNSVKYFIEEHPQDIKKAIESGKFYFLVRYDKTNGLTMKPYFSDEELKKAQKGETEVKKAAGGK